MDVVERYNTSKILNHLEASQKYQPLGLWNVAFYHCPKEFSHPEECRPAESSDPFEVAFPSPQFPGHRPIDANAAYLTHPFSEEELKKIKSYVHWNFVSPESSHHVTFFKEKQEWRPQRGHGRTLVFPVETDDLMDSKQIDVFVYFKNLPWFGPKQFPMAMVTPQSSAQYEQLPSHDAFHRSLPRVSILILSTILVLLVLIINHSQTYFWLALYFANFAGLVSLAQSIESSGSIYSLFWYLKEWINGNQSDFTKIGYFLICILQAAKTFSFTMFSVYLNEVERASKKSLWAYLFGLILLFLFVPFIFDSFAQGMFAVDGISDLWGIVLILFFSRSWLQSFARKERKTNPSHGQYSIFLWVIAGVWQAAASIYEQTHLLKNGYSQNRVWIHLISPVVYLICALISSGSFIKNQNSMIQNFKKKLDTLWQLSQKVQVLNGFLPLMDSLCELLLQFKPFEKARFKIYIANLADGNEIHLYNKNGYDLAKTIDFVGIFEENQLNKEIEIQLLPHKCIVPLWNGQRWMGQIEITPSKKGQDGGEFDFIHQPAHHPDMSYVQTLIQFGNLLVANQRNIENLGKALTEQEDFRSSLSKVVKTPLLAIAHMASESLTIEKSKSGRKESEEELAASTKNAQSILLVAESALLALGIQSDFNFLTKSHSESHHTALNQVLKSVLEYQKVKQNSTLKMEMLPAEVIFVNVDPNLLRSLFLRAFSLLETCEDRIQQISLFLEPTHSKVKVVVRWPELQVLPVGTSTRVLGLSYWVQQLKPQLLELDCDLLLPENERSAQGVVFVLPSSTHKEHSGMNSTLFGFEPVDSFLAENRFLKVSDAAMDGECLIIFDPDPLSQKMFKEQLQGIGIDLGISIISLDSLDIVTQYLETRKVALLLLDESALESNGVSFISSTRKNKRNGALPILLLSQNTSAFELSISFEMGVDDVISKPCSRFELLARVKHQLRIRRLTQSYMRFVPSKLLEILGKTEITEVKWGDQVQKNMTILFLDLRGFSQIAEQLTSQEAFSYLNDYFQNIHPIVERNGGFIDKYIGDAVLALFPNDPDQAVQAALELQEDLKKFNEIQVDKLKPMVGLGIGIHTGSVILGTLGNEHRLETTVISDAVNLASRLEGISKAWKVPIVTSAATIDACKEKKFSHRFLGRIRAKGFSKSTTIAEIKVDSWNSTHGSTAELDVLFQLALEHFYEKQFKEAKEVLNEILLKNKDDTVAQFYHRQCSKWENSIPPDPWEGVVDLREK